MAPENRKAIKIGIANYHTKLCPTTSVRRAVQITRKALEDLGYEVVDFDISSDVLQEYRDTFFAMAANGPAQTVIRDTKEACETMLSSLKNNMKIIEASDFTRKWLIDGWILRNKPRSRENIRAMRKMPKE